MWDISTSGNIMFRNSNYVMANYENLELNVQSLRCAPDLADVLVLLHSSGILERMIDDASKYDRQNPCSISCTTGMSGREDYWLMENKSFCGLPEASYGHHILHISCAGKINNGIRCFGPDFIMLMWDQFYDLTHNIVTGPKYNVIEMPLLPTTYRAGKMFFNFKESRDYLDKRASELKELIRSFREQSHACVYGTLDFISRGEREVPTIYLEKLSKETQEAIASLTDMDWQLLKTMHINETEILTSWESTRLTEEQAVEEEGQPCETPRPRRPRRPRVVTSSNETDNQ